MKTVMTIEGASRLGHLAKTIGRYPKQAAVAARLAANDVAESVITRAARDITDRYNLPAHYIREKFAIRPAKNIGQPAVVAAKIRGTSLSRFAANQLTAPAPAARGDKLRAIAAGRKQSGVSVKVLRRGQRKNLTGAFMLPRLAGKEAGGNGMGVFVRAGSRIKHLYSVSPHQAFRGWLAQRRPNISAMHAKAFAARLAREIRKAER